MRVPICETIVPFSVANKNVHTLHYTTTHSFMAGSDQYKVATHGCWMAGAETEGNNTRSYRASVSLRCRSTQRCKVHQVI